MWFSGHAFQDLGSQLWAWEILGYGFQDLGSQLWGLDFHTRGFQDRNLKTFRTWFSGCGISILGPGFHTGSSRVALGHGHPLVLYIKVTMSVCLSRYWNPYPKKNPYLFVSGLKKWEACLFRDVGQGQGRAGQGGQGRVRAVCLTNRGRGRAGRCFQLHLHLQIDQVMIEFK